MNTVYATVVLALIVYNVGWYWHKRSVRGQGTACGTDWWYSNKLAGNVIVFWLAALLGLFIALVLPADTEIETSTYQLIQVDGSYVHSTDFGTSVYSDNTDGGILQRHSTDTRHYRVGTGSATLEVQDEVEIEDSEWNKWVLTRPKQAVYIVNLP